MPSRSSTIIAASVLWRQKSGPMLVEDPRIDLLPDGQPGPRRFKVKVVDTETRRSLVSDLLKHRYAFRGYQSSGLPIDQAVQRFTLAAIEANHTIGTISVAFDGPKKLACDESFSAEVGALRAQGRTLCEFGKLAIDPITGTKRVLASLFHVAYIVAHRVRGYDTLLIEVNPRHVRYYERMLGLKVLGGERPNRAVHAPAVLLHTEFAYIMSQIGEFGGQPERASSERSLYPFAFSLPEEAAIISRMKERLERHNAQAEEAAAPESQATPQFQPSNLIDNL